ncbi:MAG: hypothetical protein ABJF88_05040 [Rhodothermales bacterium]
MRYPFLFLLLAAAAAAQPEARSDEARAVATLDAAVAAARAGDAATLAPLVVCFTDDREFFPCDAASHAERINPLLDHLRTTFGEAIPYVADSYRTEREGDLTLHFVQVKVRRRPDAPDLPTLTFIEVDGQMLLADVSGMPPPLPSPSPADEARVKARMEALLRHAPNVEAVAPLIGCYAEEKDGSFRVWPCDPAAPADRARADDFAQRLYAFVEHVGPTGYGFARYFTDTESEGTWHVLQIDFLRPDGSGETGAIYASFMEIDGQFLLGDLEGG